MLALGGVRRPSRSPPNDTLWCLRCLASLSADKVPRGPDCERAWPRDAGHSMTAYMSLSTPGEEGTSIISDMNAPRRRTPPEKKKLALRRDSLSTSDHYEVGLKRKKKSTTRSNRHAVKQTLKDPETDALPRRKQVDLKTIGASLQKDIDRKQERRARLEQTPRKSAEARERRRQRRGGGSG